MPRLKIVFNKKKKKEKKKKTYPTSERLPVVSGVPQGTVLEPLLFLIFINDLPNCVQSRIRLFADDCILYRKIRSIKDTIILQNDLNKLADWEQKWGMVQRRAARYVTNRYRNTSSVTSMLGDLEWDTWNKTKENPTYYDVQDHQQLNWHQSRRVPSQTNSSNKI